MSSKREFKLVLAGDAGVGKTTFLKKLVTGIFETKYKATSGTEVLPVTFYTSMGEMSVKVWDTAGNNKMRGLGDGYYIGANAAFIFFDFSSRSSYRNTANWYKDITRICGKIPIVLVGNKVGMTLLSMILKRRSFDFRKCSKKDFEVFFRQFRNEDLDLINESQDDSFENYNLTMTETENLMKKAKQQALFSDAASNIAELYSSYFESLMEANIEGKLSVYKETLKALTSESFKSVPFATLVNHLEQSHSLSLPQGRACKLKGVKLKESRKRFMEIEEEEETSKRRNVN